jgi:hypothetical protein
MPRRRTLTITILYWCPLELIDLRKLESLMLLNTAKRV